MKIMKVIHGKTLKDKIIGLIGKKPGKPFYFETRWGIHTFGMEETIDVTILDSKNRVRKIKIGLRPNRIFLWNPKFSKVIELSQGTINKKRIRIGTTLNLSD